MIDKNILLRLDTPIQHQRQGVSHIAVSEAFGLFTVGNSKEHASKLMNQAVSATIAQLNKAGQLYDFLDAKGVSWWIVNKDTGEIVVSPSRMLSPGISLN